MVSEFITGTLVLGLSIFIICLGNCCLTSTGFSIGVGIFGVISIFAGITVALFSIASCFIGMVDSFLFSEIAISLAMSVGLITLILLFGSTLSSGFFSDSAFTSFSSTLFSDFFGTSIFSSTLVDDSTFASVVGSFVTFSSILASSSVFTSGTFSSVGLSLGFSSAFSVISEVLTSCFVSPLVSLGIFSFGSSSFLSVVVSFSASTTSPIDFVSDSFSLPSSGSVSISITRYTSSKLVRPAIHLPRASWSIVIVLLVYTMSLNSSLESLVLFKAFLISSSNSSTSCIAIRPLYPLRQALQPVGLASYIFSMSLFMNFLKTFFSYLVVSRSKRHFTHNCFASLCEMIPVRAVDSK